MLRIFSNLFHSILKLQEAVAIIFLDEELVRFIIDNHLKLTKIKRLLPVLQLILEETWHSDKHLRGFNVDFAFTDNKADSIIGRESIEHTVNLPDQFARVCQNNNLDLFDVSVNLHQRRDPVGACLATAVDCLEEEVRVGLCHHVGNGDRLNDARAFVSHQVEAILQLFWHVERVPCGLFRLEVHNDCFEIERPHTVHELVSATCAFWVFGLEVF